MYQDFEFVCNATWETGLGGRLERQARETCRLGRQAQETCRLGRQARETGSGDMQARETGSGDRLRQQLYSVKCMPCIVHVLSF